MDSVSTSCASIEDRRGASLADGTMSSSKFIQIKGADDNWGRAERLPVTAVAWITSFVMCGYIAICVIALTLPRREASPVAVGPTEQSEASKLPEPLQKPAALDSDITEFQSASTAIALNAADSIEQPAPKKSQFSDPANAIPAGSGAFFKDRAITGDACERCPEMIVVPAGSFFMGGGAHEPGREDWQKETESPRTKISIARPFAVGRAAISFREWEACVSEGECVTTPSDNGWGKGDLPVINLTWNDANVFAAWLSRKTGLPYRLLSEAEREYAARAGTATAFWFGTSASPKYANYLWDRTLPTKELQPNPWGMFHALGNVNEWTADCWNPSHAGHLGDSAPRFTGNCARRVVKGGSWFNVPGLIRAAGRSGLPVDATYQTVGFRVARSIGMGEPAPK